MFNSDEVKCRQDFKIISLGVSSLILKVLRTNKASLAIQTE